MSLDSMTRLISSLRPWLGGVLSMVAVALSVALALRLQHVMLHYGVWQDEAETLVVSRMLGSGLTLYSEIFNQHGPLVFLFGWLLDLGFHPGFAGYRTLIAVLQWCMIAAVAVSLPGTDHRARSFILIVVLVYALKSLRVFFGQMFVYQSLTGIFIAIAVAVQILPHLRGDGLPGRWRGLVCGGLLACLPFLAFTYTPCAAGLFLCALKRSTWRDLVLGAVVAAAANGLFILLKCSVPGMLAEHFYLNLVIYPAYVPGLVATWLIADRPSLLFAFGGLTLLVITVWLLVRRDRASVWRCALFALSLCSLLARGPSFQAEPFYYAIVPLIPYVILQFWTGGLLCLTAASAIALLCLLKLSLLLPQDREDVLLHRLPKHSEFADLVRQHTTKGDRVISYAFNNLEYVLADRLPASAEFYLLPQERDYNAAPVLGINLDACRDIRSVKPKIMRLDKWTAWDKYKWETYGACVDEIAREDYVQLDSGPIYVRRDVFSDVMAARNKDPQAQQQP